MKHKINDLNIMKDKIVNDKQKHIKSFNIQFLVMKYDITMIKLIIPDIISNMFIPNNNFLRLNSLYLMVENNCLNNSDKKNNTV